MEAPTFLLLVLCVGVSASSAVDLHKRIHGGKECDPQERLYHVALATDPKGDNIICGGSLISDQWVLTAAHCKEDKIYAVPGVHPVPGKPVEIEEYVLYTDPSHDIMLVKLPDSVKDIKPKLPQIDLPTKGNCNEPPKGQTVNIAGHGTNTVDANGIKVGEPVNLLCVDLHVVKCPYTEEDILKCSGLKAEHIFCAGNDQDKKEGKDTGKGDSGGGIVYKGLLHGVHMADGEKPCITKAIFLDICHYLDWILKTIKN